MMSRSRRLKKEPRFSRLPRRGREALCLLSALLIAVPGCGVRNLKRIQAAPDQHGILDARSPYLKVYLKNGELCLLRDWSVNEEAGVVAGTGERLGPDRELIDSGEYAVPADSVVLLETNRAPVSGNLIPLVLVTIVSLVTTVVVIHDPPSFEIGD
ncbi:MAG: hypothetical protein JW958_08300 [Candidatus Eisenbacteria bacterium]|nr:hypothetical protein [Candidatus Eisenbacteria bacterium]